MTADLINSFQRGDRQALAKVITLVESTTAFDQAQAKLLLSQLAATDCERETLRIAISGPPGVGKSTFINSLGQKIVARGMRLAVLPIDPSSDITNGSILGDKTRMKNLMQRDDIYVRPSPSKGALGGVSFSTQDVLYVVEAFGFDCVIIETVGVGQSEMFARLLADHFVVLMQPGAGDQIQAMKKGIIERADYVLVNKSDGEQKDLARTTLVSLRALAAHDHERSVYLASVSSLEDAGVDQFLDAVLKRQQSLKESGALNVARMEKRIALCKVLFAHRCAQKMQQLPTIAKRCEQLARGNHALGPLIAELVDDVVLELG